MSIEPKQWQASTSKKIARLNKQGHGKAYESPGNGDASGEGDVLPGGDDDVLRLEGLGADHRLPDVPLGSFADLDSELVLPGVQVSLQSEIQRLSWSFSTLMVGLELAKARGRGFKPNSLAHTCYGPRLA